MTLNVQHFTKVPSPTCFLLTDLYTWLALLITYAHNPGCPISSNYKSLMHCQTSSPPNLSLPDSLFFLHEPFILRPPYYHLCSSSIYLETDQILPVTAGKP